MKESQILAEVDRRVAAVLASMPRGAVDTTAIIRALRLWRIRLGLSQAEVGQMMGLTGATHICEWETGRVKPRATNINRWTEALRRADADRK